MRLRVVSWNVHRCIGSDGQYSPERIAEVLSELQPDVVALQEIDSSLLTENEVDQLTAIATQTGLKSLMGPTMKRGYGVYGNAVLFKDELVSFEERDLSYRKFEPRGALSVRLRLAGGYPFTLVNTHLGLKYWERVYQVERLLNELSPSETELGVVAGDFNEWLAISPNSLRLNRAFQPCKKLRSFPSRWPRLPLDRILPTAAWKYFEHSVVDGRTAKLASDHLPILADLYRD